MSDSENQFCSRTIHSNQAGIHERLEEIVRKHIQTQYQKPFQTHNIKAFEVLQSKIEASGHNSLILDSCCGTGMSTRTIAVKNPSSLVIGIDRSSKRLNKQDTPETPGNCHFMQADCEDIWRLCVENHIVFQTHYILYPNPYPKAIHVKRRWHGHPVFPVLKQLAPSTVVRSNWKTYLDEFEFSWKILTDSRPAREIVSVEEPLTLFERKFAGSHQTLYQLYARSKCNTL